MSLNVTANVTNFVNEINKLVEDKGLDVMDAVVYYCEKHNVEIETAASIIKQNAKIKARLMIEAENLNYLPKRARLPL